MRDTRTLYDQIKFPNSDLVSSVLMQFTSIKNLCDTCTVTVISLQIK